MDAIIGGAKHMHVVLDALCTGCELCVPACPVDCIVMEPLSESAFDPVRTQQGSGQGDPASTPA